MTPAQLTTELRGYRKLRRYGVKEPIAEPAMTVTELPESADAFLLDHVRLLLSVTGRLDQGFLDGVRRRAVRYPNDPFAQRTLARAEFVMGDVAKGEAIMKAQLEARPQDLETHLLAGMGQVLAGLRNNAERVARFRAARPHLGKAYALDNEDFRPLYAYTLSRSIEPQFPSDNDLTALLEARALAPSVQELSLRAGMALIRRGRRDEAKIILTAVANNPHGGSAAAQAKALIEGKTAAAAEPVAKEADGQSVPAL